MREPRREIPEPTYHWPGGPTADDDPTPIESALAALKFGAILAAGVTIVFFYLATYSGFVVRTRRREPCRTCGFRPAERDRLPQSAWVRSRRRPPAAVIPLRYTYWL